jgi:hypothetical protein
MIALLALACRLAAELPAPEVGVDPPATHEAIADPPAQSEPPFLVRIQPAEPAYDDDLRCVVEGLPAGSVPAIRWEVNGLPWSGSVMTTSFSGDTIPHLSQAGGQKWKCTAIFDESAVSSSESRIESFIPTISVIPEVFNLILSKTNTISNVRIVNNYEIAIREVTIGEAEQLLPDYRFPLDDVSDDAIFPGAEKIYSLRMLNAMSELDGLTKCYNCTETSCDYSTIPSSCDGYRLPTLAEWQFAARERDAHAEEFPSGGIQVDFLELSYYDTPLHGSRVPPNTTISDQCWCQSEGYRTPMQKMPNALGLYDMCGTSAEFVADLANFDFNPSDFDRTASAFINGENVIIFSNYDAFPSYCGIYNYNIGPRVHAGLRIARTNFPLPPGGSP